jgi:DNA-binding NarL/FixJ family response regulator
MIRLVLAEDRALIREGYRRLVADAPDLSVAAETSTGADLLDRAPDIDADVVVLGVARDWPRIVSMIPSLRRAGLHVLVLATAPHPVDVQRAVAAGAAGVVTTAVSASDLVDAIHKAADGRSLPASTGSASPQNDGRDATPGLSNREFEVMCMLGSGLSVRDIADRLNLSPKTVGTYRGRVMDKLGLDNTAELVRFVLERGLAR